MCGIVGFITDEKYSGNPDKKKFMEQGLIVDMLRGMDSTGIYCVSHGAEKQAESPCGWLKQAVDGASFVRTKRYTDFVQDIGNYKFMVGHNRAATIGDTCTDNAHPFIEGPITLVHNGTLRHNSGLPVTQRELGYDVDSHALTWNLAQMDGSKKEVGNFLKGINGDFALVWHDSRDDTLNIVRNSARPFHFAQVKGQNTIYFASEGHMLHMLGERLRLGLDQIVYPKPGLWMKFHGGQVCRPELHQLDFTKAGYGAGTGKPTGKSGKHNGQRSWPNPAGSKATPVDDVGDNTNKVQIGGKRRDVPQAHQELLMEHGLVVEDRLTFLPLQFNRIPDDTSTTNFAIVSGYLEDYDLPAVIMKMTEDVAKGNFDNRWTVRPIAVRRVVHADGREEEVIICKVVATYVRGAISVPKNEGAEKPPTPAYEVTSTTTSTEKDGKETTSTRTSTGEDTEQRRSRRVGDGYKQKNPVTGEDTVWLADEAKWVSPQEYDEKKRQLALDNLGTYTPRTLPGPEGSVRLREWYELTKDGCALCMGLFMIQDAPSISWASSIDTSGDKPSELFEPYCPGCAIEAGILRANNRDPEDRLDDIPPYNGQGEV